ncbi:MAG: hypothetical protein IJ201_10185 [Solobacterium sp.]|nr:hypothetical protein [Solobacterium sp.]
MGKRILGIIEYLVIAAVAGFLLIVGVYAIPKTRMVNNINRSKELLETEGNYRYWAADVLNTQSDNFTDSLMADIAINPGTGKLLYDSMINCYVGWADTDNSSTWLLRVAGGEPLYEGYEQVVYGRYWHGYLVWMKPLLLVFNIPELRIINMGLQLFLLCWMMILLYRELGLLACLGVGIGLFSMNPITMALSLQFSSIYYIVLVTLIVMLRHRNYIESRNLWWAVFLWSGIAVAFFDLMTYPAVAMGIPLIVYLMLKNDGTWKHIWNVIRLSIDWVIGYAGMWVIKWFIGSAFTGYDLVADGLGAVGLRSSGEVANINMSYLNVLQENFHTIFTKPLPFFAAVFVLVLIIGLIFRKLKFSVSVSKLLPLILVGTYPFIWYYVIRNHSIVHVWFTHRVFAITVTALCALPYCFLKVREKTQ